MLLLDNMISDDAVTRVVIFTLLPFLVAFVFIFFIFLRRSREVQLRRKQLELELNALRAQMSPHFIFNCLNSIHYCIQQQESEKAGDYLLKFSYLTRRILENSSKRWISLEEDLSMLKSYLDLEQFRAGHRFRYTIQLGENVLPEDTAVPMLIVQPFVENAIWHGFHSRQEDGEIKIEISATVDEVIFRINDNGTVAPGGVKIPDQQNPGKQRSLGQSLVSDQLAAIRELEKRDATFHSTPRTNANGEYIGLTTELILPFIPLHG